MIKFLKKFKEKILIALACSFIGIGTILSNTIETKAYVSDEFSYTLTFDYIANDGSYHYNLNNPLIPLNNESLLNLYDVCIVCELDSSSYTNNSTINSSFGFNNSYYVGGNYRKVNNHTTTTLVTRGSYNFNLSSVSSILIWFTDISSDKIIHLDCIYSKDISTLPYINDYVGQLQSDYDTLQAEYTSYQNTHAYTNEQYNDLMSQNVSLTQQVQSLQSQYDTYVSLHSYTNEQYNTLLTNYNNLQNMYSNLQASYLVLQQQYDSLALSVAPFMSSKWNNRTGSLNGVTYDMQTEYRDSLVSFEKTYLYIYPRDLDVFENYSTSINTFVLTAYCDEVVILSGFNVIANMSHIREESFQIDFYLDNSLVYSSIDFDNDMGDDDSNTITVDRFIQFNQITITVVVDYAGLYSSNGYFNAVVGSWQDGYDYAVGQLMPQINQLEQDLQQSNAQQQVKFNEGYNKGISDSNSQPLYGMVIRIL